MIRQVSYPNDILSFPERVIIQSDEDIKELNNLLGEDFRSYIEDFLIYAHRNVKPNFENDYVSTWINKHGWKNFTTQNCRNYMFNRINAGHSLPSDKKNSAFSEILLISIRSDNRIEINDGSKVYNILIDDDWMNKMFNKWYDLI